MTREELKKHCEKQLEHCKRWAEQNREEPQGNIYEEHKLILELLEQESILDKIRSDIMECLNELDEVENEIEYSGFNLLNEISSKRAVYKQCLEIIDKHKPKGSDKEWQR